MPLAEEWKSWSEEQTSCIPRGVGLGANLHHVNNISFNTLLGRQVDLCLGSFSEFCGVSSLPGKGRWGISLLTVLANHVLSL